MVTRIGTIGTFLLAMMANAGDWVAAAEVYPARLETTIADAIWRAPAPGARTEVGFGIRIMNPNAEAKELPLFDVLLPYLVDAEGKSISFSITREKTRPEVPLVVGAGKSMDLPFGGMLSGPAGDLKLIVPEPGGGIWIAQGIKPGRHRLGFRYGKREEVGKNAWPGATDAREVSILIVDGPAGKTSEPVKKDGLEFSTRVAKAEFAPGEAVAFEVVVHNGSEQARDLYRPRSIWGWKIGLGPWRAVPPPAAAAPADEFVHTLAPGESCAVLIVMDRLFSFMAVPDGTAVANGVIPTGSYDLRVNISYEQPARALVPDARYWTGTVTTEPVKVAIGKSV